MNPKPIIDFIRKAFESKPFQNGLEYANILNNNKGLLDNYLSPDNFSSESR